MNNEEQVSVWELLKGIVNFLLAIILVLSLSAGEFGFGLVSLLGLIIINISLLKAYLTHRIFRVFRVFRGLKSIGG